jgi:Spy/CpxP family protein refolding chaperone
MVVVRIWAARALLAAAAFALAPPPPAGAEPWSALEIAAYLQKRLDLSREQLRELRPAVDAYSSAVSAAVDARRGQGPEGWSGLLDEIEEQHQVFEAELARVLTPEQMRELDALRTEIREGAAARIEDQALSGVQERLGLSEAAREQVFSILREDWKSKRELVERYRGKAGRSASRDIGKELAAIHEDTEARLAGVLTPEQMSEFRSYREEQRRRILDSAKKRRRGKA